MKFEILVDDQYLQIFQETTDAAFENKSILSLVNDFEDMAWRYHKFENFIWDNIAFTALSEQERKKLSDQSGSTLRESAKKLRLTDKPKDKGEGSELAEIVLYGIMHHHFKALSVVPKIFYKQNSQDFAKGADSVHIVVDEVNNDFSLWFGEAKFYNSIDDARLGSIITSVKNSLMTEKLEKENSIITNTSDIDSLKINKDLVEKIKLALSTDNSMDNIKPKLHIPILLLHECTITAESQKMDDDYRKKVRDYHLDRAKVYFAKQINSLSGKISMYSDIKFHIILFPVPNRDNLIKRFTNMVAVQKA
jgi:hypothetical protein